MSSKVMISQVLLVLTPLFTLPLESHNMHAWKYLDSYNVWGVPDFLTCYQCREEQGYVGDTCRVVTKLTPRVSMSNRDCAYRSHGYYYSYELGCVFGVDRKYNNGPRTVVRVMQYTCPRYTDSYRNYACGDSGNEDMDYCYYCQENLCNTGYDVRFTGLQTAEEKMFVNWHFRDPDYEVKATGPIWIEDKNVSSQNRTVLIDSKDIMESAWNRILEVIHDSCQWFLRLVSTSKCNVQGRC